LFPYFLEKGVSKVEKKDEQGKEEDKDKDPQIKFKEN
jgi:hypothetical protein